MGKLIPIVLSSREYHFRYCPESKKASIGRCMRSIVFHAMPC